MKHKRPPIAAAVYKHEEVAALFQLDRTQVYDRADIMACRLPGNPPRYSMRRIDAILNMEPIARRA